MAPAYEALVEWLLDRYGERLRWTASFDSKRFDYKIRHIREDLKPELSEQQLDTMIHRSLTAFSRDRANDVYFHLGDAEGLIVVHERAMAVHLYLEGSTGIVIKLQKDAPVTVPTFFEECLQQLGVEPNDS